MPGRLSACLSCSCRMHQDGRGCHTGMCASSSRSRCPHLHRNWRFCTRSAPCAQVERRLGLMSRTGRSEKAEILNILHRVRGIWTANPAPRLSFKAFHRAKSNVLNRRAPKCASNTTYCGLRLTCTIDSGIFPSAALSSELQRLQHRHSAV